MNELRNRNIRGLKDSRCIRRFYKGVFGHYQSKDKSFKHFSRYDIKRTFSSFFTWDKTKEGWYFWHETEQSL